MNKYFAWIESWNKQMNKDYALKRASSIIIGYIEYHKTKQASHDP
jgi:hypothetical protein